MGSNDKTLLNRTDQRTRAVDLDHGSSSLSCDGQPGQAEAAAEVRIPAGARRSWSIGMYRGASPFDLSDMDGAGNPVVCRETVHDMACSFVADPFMVLHDGIWHMFFEAKNWAAKKGEIALATSRDTLNWRYEGVVLAEPFHLSYPCVFDFDGDFYMTPETLDAKYIRLYKADSFPLKWSYHAALAPGFMADPTPFRFDNRWWMFACSTPYEHHTLRLYLADEVTGPWIEHPMSPIVRGSPRIARPAGRVIIYDGRPVRFAQDCEPDYGTRVRAFQIDLLTATDYRECERPESPVLRPTESSGWNGDGMHHLDPHLMPDGRWIACVDGRHLD